MASIVASRQHLQHLHDNVPKAKKAFRQAEDTYNALYTRQDQRRRREWGLDSDDEDDEDGSEIDSDSELGREIEENKTDSEGEGEDQAKEAKSDEFADEEEEGFDFEAKSSRLEAVRDQSKADVTKALSAFVDDFERCAKADVLGPLTELYTTMCTKLSIEIRNIIYTYLVKRIDYPYQVHHDTYSYWNPNFQSYESTAIDHWLKRAERAFEYGTWDILKPGGWLLNPEFVGHGLARELAEVFYTVNEFAANDARFLPDLLTADRTLTGFKPYEYIRGQFNAYISTTCGNGSNECAWQTTENEVEFLDGVYKNLNLIQLITHKSQLSVTIGVSSSSPLREDAIEGDRRFHNIMEAIRSPVYDLMYSGVKVLVKHTAHSSYRTRTISEGGELNYFAMSKEEWEKEKSSHGPDWLPSQDFISKEELQDDRNKVRVRELLKQKWGHVKSIDAYGI